MSNAIRVAVLLGVLLPTISTGALAQGPIANPPVIQFQFLPERTFQYVGLAEGTVGPNGLLPKDAYFNYIVRDISVESQTAAASSNPDYHYLSFKVDWVNGKHPGGTWSFINNTSSRFMRAGDVAEGTVAIRHEANEILTGAALRVEATLRSQADPSRFAVHNETFTVKIYPTPGIQIEALRPPLNARPNQFVTIPVLVTNTDLYPQQLEIAVRFEPGAGVNPQNIPVTGAIPVLLEPLEARQVNITFRTPKDQFYYGSVAVIYTVRATNAQTESINQQYTGVVIVQGFYWSRQTILVIPILVLLTALFFYLLFAAKRYYDERILGKPIPPWRIPEEAAALTELRKTAPREFYLRRYFFMEEEHQSALNWFYGFKKRTKKQLSKAAKAAKLEERASSLSEPSLARFDRRADRLTRRYRTRQERQRLRLESKLEGLQAKLDQHYEDDYDKDHQKWEEKVEKIKKKANKPWFKAHKKWEAEVETIMEAWEKPFRKEKEKADKAREKALERYAAEVKKKDKQTWRDWREAVENAELENKIRAKEGRDPIPLPELVSQEVSRPELPPLFKPPPKPKLPPEPAEPKNIELPPEPQLVKPKLEESHYARKTRRAKRKTERKVRRLEAKLERALAKNERDRVRALAKADRKRNKIIHQRREVFEPTIFERLFRLTPEHREYRARRKLMAALAKEKVRQLEEAEESRLEVMRVDAERREAELLAKLVRNQASVRSGSGTSGMRVDPAKDPGFVALHQRNQANLQKERAASEARLKAEEARIHKELQAQLTEELIKERARSRPPVPPKAESAKPKKA